MRHAIPDPIAYKGELYIAGVVPFSSVDFPGCLAAVLFLQGCPWACRYCHNPHLRPFHLDEQPEWNWYNARNFLESRVGFLDGVVFSGGEPTGQSPLVGAIVEARSMGYRIGLHTAGSYPERLKLLLPIVDWIGLDIKAPLDKRYDLVTGAENSATRVLDSLIMIMNAGIPHQLRTTIHSSLLSEQDLADINSQLSALGAQPTLVQRFRSQGCADAELIASAPI